MQAVIKMYGTQWCPDCIRAKQVFQKHNIPYQWIDITHDAAGCEVVEKLNNGMRRVPSILFPDGAVLVEPSNAELEKKLGIRS
jgi:mycoredoxin